MQRLWFSVLALLVGTAIALVVVEIVTRIVGAAPEVTFLERGSFRLSHNPRLGYEPVPEYESKGRSLLSFTPDREPANLLGFRDRDWARRKPPGTYRIAVLGDSIAAGRHIRDREDVFPFLTERALRERGFVVEVLNFAVSGYNTQQEVEALKEYALPFDPDLVLVAYCHNDNRRSDGRIMEQLLDQELRSEGVSQALLSPWLSRSALFRFLRFRVLPEPDLEDLAQRRTGFVSKDTRAESFAELRDLVQRKDFSVLVAIFPRFRSLDDYPYLDRHRDVRRLVDPLGFDVIDLLPAMQDCARRHPDQSIALDDMHPGEIGHACAAEALVGHLTRHQLIEFANR